MMTKQNQHKIHQQKEGFKLQLIVCKKKGKKKTNKYV